MAAVAGLGLTVTGCSGGSATPGPTGQPKPPAAAATLVSVQVSASATTSDTIEPGQALQLTAQATYSDGHAADVTREASWQSSNPTLATVSPTGLLTAAAVEGTIDVTATYQQVAGTIRTQVRRPGCEKNATLSPANRAEDSAGWLPWISTGDSSGGYQILVNLPRPDCRWKVQVDAGWLSFNLRFDGDRKAVFDPQRSGSGGFAYYTTVNRSFSSRVGHAVVTFADGGQVVHTVTQAPASCIISVSPQVAIFHASGSGFFDVTATPSSCRWELNVTDGKLVTVTGLLTGVGSRRVDYTATVPTGFFTFLPEVDAPIVVFEAGGKMAYDSRQQLHVVRFPKP